MISNGVCIEVHISAIAYGVPTGPLLLKSKELECQTLVLVFMSLNTPETRNTQDMFWAVSVHFCRILAGTLLLGSLASVKYPGRCCLTCSVYNY